ncbi:MAG: hypothetical protein Q4D44_00595 [Eubacteriales bacterium]|nr:hypothetical protein [Eubacteriales bacterium]
MNNKNINTEEILKSYFSHDVPQLSFNPAKKRSIKKPLLAVAALILAVLTGFFVYAYALSKQEPMIYVSNSQSVALADIPRKSAFKLPLGQEETPTRVGLIRYDGQDMVFVTAVSKTGDGSFLRCSDDLCESRGLTPEIELHSTGEKKTPADWVIDEEKYRASHSENGVFRMSTDYGNDNSFTIGYYNQSKTDDEIILTGTFVDGTTTTYHIDVKYNPDASVEQVLKLALLSVTENTVSVKLGDGDTATVIVQPESE